MKFHIYGLIDPRNNNLRYVGFTQQVVKNRANQHFKPAKLKVNNRKNNWIKSVKSDGLTPQFLTLESYEEKNEALQAEIDLIAYFKYIGCDLTNVTSGGDEGAKYVRTDEVKAKISKSSKGRKHTQVTKNKISSSLQGLKRNHSTEHRLKISKSLSNRKLTEELKLKSVKGKITKLTSSKIANIKELYLVHACKVSQIAELFSVHPSTISRVINNKLGKYLQ